MWQSWYVGQIDGTDYARLMLLPGYQHDLDVVTIAPNWVIATYTHGWIDSLNQIGVIRPVGARTAYRRQGLTRSALLEVLCRLRAFGMTRACISTGQANTPALRGTLPDEAPQSGANLLTHAPGAASCSSARERIID